jgi:xanthine dehydrogenase small subunit
MVDGALHIGAAAPLEDAWAALAARWPTLREVGLRFAGPPVRHAGTLGGNIANGSPIGDGAPVLMALDARLVLRQGARQRELRLDQFYLDYMKNQLEPGEFLQAIIVPSPSPLTQVRAYKVSKRHDCDISALCAGFSLKLHDGVVADVRLAFGGMAAIVKRAATAEAAMLGKPWNQATLGEAKKALVNDFAPLTDLRASAAYRQRVAGALLERFWLETRADAPLAPSSLNVRACKVSP